MRFVLRGYHRAAPMDSSDSALTGQVAVVTGASSGLGRATALALAEAGATVGLLARGADDLASIADALASRGHEALPVSCDLGDAEAPVGAVERIRAQLGPVRTLVNAAATDAPGPVTELSFAAWDRVLAVNLRACSLSADRSFRT